MFNNYAIVQGVDHIVPVDMYLPGCPPRPEMLIDAILKLHAKILDEPLGAKRAAETEGQRTELVASSVRYGKLPAPIGTPEVNDPQRWRAGRGMIVTAGPGRYRRPHRAATAGGAGRRKPTGGAGQPPDATRAPAGGPPSRPAPPAASAAGDQRRRRPAAGPPALTGVERTGMFGSHGSGDTSGYGLLVSEPYTPAPAERPYGGYFDEVADALPAAMARAVDPAAGDPADHRRQRRDHLLPRTATPRRDALGGPRRRRRCGSSCLVDLRGGLRRGCAHAGCTWSTS